MVIKTIFPSTSLNYILNDILINPEINITGHLGIIHSRTYILVAITSF